jgi:Zn-finger nucleic acid-binding protein
MAEVNIQHTVIVDQCPKCAGIVLDRGEMEMIEALGLAQVIESGEAAPHQRRQGAAHCHDCDRDMTALNGAGDVEFDWCDGCERVFFDRGELSSISAFTDER